MKKNFSRVLGAISALALAGAAHAQEAASVDVSAITSAGATVATIGAAVFAVYVGIKLYKWIRGAL